MDRVKHRAKLIRPLLIPFVLYVGALVIMVAYLDSVTSGWKYVIALLPVLPAIFITLGVINAINQLDELERRIMLEAAVFSLMTTTLGLMIFGFLKQVGVEQPPSPFIIIFMMFMWLLGKLLGNRKYK
jgi:UDP-N-acetylmuramyl pentapeptide phosphotransferase/UDP-N-acetylglucosamine-1-phosphate transferase